MKLPRRRFLHLAAGAAALPAVSQSACHIDVLDHPVDYLTGDLTPRVASHGMKVSLAAETESPGVGPPEMT
jgi:hypothetical protein